MKSNINKEYKQKYKNKQKEMHCRKSKMFYTCYFCNINITLQQALQQEKANKENITQGMNTCVQ